MIFSLEVLGLIFLGGFRWCNPVQNSLSANYIPLNIFSSLTISCSGHGIFSYILL